MSGHVECTDVQLGICVDVRMDMCMGMYADMQKAQWTGVSIKSCVQACI